MNTPPRTYRIVTAISPGLAAPYIALDFIQAFEALGHTVMSADFRMVCDHDANTQARFLLEFAERVREFKPDFAFFYDAAGLFDFPGGNPGGAPCMFEALGVPYVSLFFDSPLLTMYLNGIMKCMQSPMYTVCIWDHYYLKKFTERFGKEAHYLPLAANTHVFRPLDAPPEFESDVTFIGSIAESEDFDATRRGNQWPDWLCRLANFVVEQKRKRPELLFDDILEMCVESLPEDMRSAYGRFRGTDEHSAFVCSMYDQLGRHARTEALRALPSCRAHVHGGGGWRNLNKPGLDILPHADYHAQTPLVYNAARINLNITSTQLVTAVNQRVFDVPACRAFLLTDHRGDLPQLFTPDEEVVIYNDLADLRKKVRYYLEHDDERRAIAQRAYERVLKEHTYEHRAQEVIRLLQDKKFI